MANDDQNSEAPLPFREAAARVVARDEAIALYRAHLAGSHTFECCGVEVTIVFEWDATHVFSIAAKDGETIAPEDAVTRRIPRGKQPPRIEVRRFNAERARLMGWILPTIAKFLVSVPESGGRDAHEKRVLYGTTPIADRYMRVVLRRCPFERRGQATKPPVSWQPPFTALRRRRAWAQPDAARRTDMVPNTLTLSMPHRVIPALRSRSMGDDVTGAKAKRAMRRAGMLP